MNHHLITSEGFVIIRDVLSLNMLKVGSPKANRSWAKDQTNSDNPYDNNTHKKQIKGPFHFHFPDSWHLACIPVMAGDDHSLSLSNLVSSRLLQADPAAVLLLSCCCFVDLYCLVILCGLHCLVLPCFVLTFCFILIVPQVCVCVCVHACVCACTPFFVLVFCILFTELLLVPYCFIYMFILLCLVNNEPVCLCNC